MAGYNADATYKSGSGTAALVFTKTIANTDVTGARSFAVEEPASNPARGLQLDGGTIRSAAMVNAVLTGTSLARKDNAHMIGTIMTGTTVRSTPATGNTYAIGERLTVDAEFNRDLVFQSSLLGSTDRTKLTLSFENGTRTADYVTVLQAGFRFGYTIAEGDVDTDGVGIGKDALAIGELRLLHYVPCNDAVPMLSTDTVDGVRPTLLTESPNQPRTSTDGTTITLTFDEPLSATTAPVGAFTVMVSGMERTVSAVAIDDDDVNLTLGSAVGMMDTITVAYADPTGDNDANAVQDAAGNDSETFAAQTVTNNAAAGITVSSIALTSMPGTDGLYAIDDAVVATVTASEAMGVSGTPQLELDIGGRPKTADCALQTDTTKLACSYTVALGDEDTDGVAVEANRLKLNGAAITKASGDPGGLVLTHDALSAQSGHKVDGIRPTLTRADASQDLTKIVLTFGEAIGTVDNTKITVKKGGTDQTTTGAAIDTTNTTKVEITLMTALARSDTNVTVDLAADAVTDLASNGILEDLATSVTIEDTTSPTLASAGTYAIDGTGTGIALEFDETIVSTSIPAASAFAAKIGTTAVGVTSVTRDTTDADTVNLVLNANPKAGESVTVSYTLPGSNPLEDAAGNDVASFTDQTVTNNAAAPGKPTVTVAAKDASLEVTVAFTAHGTHNITKYQYQVKTTGSFGAWTDSTDGVSNTGGTFTIGGLTNGTAHTVKVRGVSAAGNGAESDEAMGTPDAPPVITSVELTSIAAHTSIYRIGEAIVVTLGFNKALTLSGTGAEPYLDITLGTTDKQAECTLQTDTTKLACSYTVSEGDEDNNGTSIDANSLTASGKMILGPLGQAANLNHPRRSNNSNHKVDGVKPTLSSANASGDLSKVVLTFSEAIGTVDNTEITVKKGGTDQTTTGPRSTRPTPARSKSP